MYQYQIHECAGIPRYEYIKEPFLDEQSYVEKKMEEAKVLYDTLSQRSKQMIEELIVEATNTGLGQNLLNEIKELIGEKSITEMMEEIYSDLCGEIPNKELIKIIQSITTDNQSGTEIEEQIERFIISKRNHEGEF